MFLTFLHAYMFSKTWNIITGLNFFNNVSFLQPKIWIKYLTWSSTEINENLNLKKNAYFYAESLVEWSGHFL